MRKHSTSRTRSSDRRWRSASRWVSTSTTFDAQLDVATRVAAESPELYYEIQSLNDYGEESLTALRSAVERLWQTVHHNDADAFTAMMQRGHDYLLERQAALEQPST